MISETIKKIPSASEFYSKILFLLFLTYASLVPFSSTFAIHTAPYLMLFFWLLENDLKKKFSTLYHDKVTIWLVIFFLVNLASIFWTENQQIAFKTLKTYFAFLIPFIIIVTSFNKQKLLIIIKFFLFFTFISEIFSIGVFFKWFDINGTPHYDPSPFLNHIHFGILLSVTSIILLHYFLNTSLMESSKTHIYKIMYLIFLILTILTLFINAGRTGQVVFIVGIFASIITKYGLQWRKLLFIIILMFSILGFSYKLSPVFNQRTNQILDSIKKIQDGNYNVPLGYRLGLKLDSIPVIKENIILGVGVGDAIDEFYKNEKKLKYVQKSFPHLHDQFLQILLDTGLLGFIPFLLFLLNLFKVNYQDENHKAILYGILAIFILASFADLTIRTSLAALFSFSLATFYTIAKT